MKLWKIRFFSLLSVLNPKWDFLDLQLKLDSIWKKGYNEGMPRGKGSTNQLKYFIIIVESFHILILKKKIFFGQIHEKNKLQPILKH